MTRRLPIILLTLVLIGAALALGQIILQYQDYPFFYDEAIHANGGLALAVELQNGNLPGFVQEFYSQGFYPPTFSVGKAFAYLLFGSTTAVARGFSLVCLVLAQLVIFLFSQRMWVDFVGGTIMRAGREDGRFLVVSVLRRSFGFHKGLTADQQLAGWVGLTAVLLTLTSLPLLNASTHVMMEAPGLLISFVFLWLYYRTFAVSALDGTHARPAASDKRGFTLTSVALMGVFLTKYTYGLAMLGTVGIMELTMLDWRSAWQLRQMGSPWLTAAVAPFRPAFNRWLYLFGPFVLLMVWWFGAPFKLGQFFGYATAQPNDAQWTLDALFFYPRNIALQQLPSPLFGLVSVLGLIWAGRHVSRPGVRLLLIYFVVGMVEMLLNFPKIPRFVVTFLPAMHILTGMFLVSVMSDQWSVISRQLRATQTGYQSLKHWSLVTLLVVSLIWAVPVLYGRYSTFNTLMSAQLKTAPAVNAVPRWVDDNIPDGSRFYVVNFFELVNMESLAWGMVNYGDDNPADFDDYLMDGQLLAAPSAENVQAFRNAVLASGAEFVVVIEGGDWGGGWPAYDRQLQDFVQYHAHQEFRVDVVNRPEDLLWGSLIDGELAEYVLENERGTFNLKLLIYRVNG